MERRQSYVLGEPLEIIPINTEFKTDESRQFIVKYPHGSYFFRVPHKQAVAKIIDTFFYRSLLNILYPNISVRQISIERVPIQKKSEIGTMSIPIQNMSVDYYTFFTRYYREAHGRRKTDPMRGRFFHSIAQFEHPHFVRNVAEPVAQRIYVESGLAVDTEAPVNVGNHGGNPLFFEVFSTHETNARLVGKLRARKIGRGRLEEYWGKVPTEFRDKLLAKFDSIF